MLVCQNETGNQPTAFYSNSVLRPKIETNTDASEILESKKPLNQDD